MRALIIREPWLTLILSRRKTWELRSRRTSIRGSIGLIRAGTSLVVGRCSITDVIGPLNADTMRLNHDAHAESGEWNDKSDLPYPNTYAWILADAQPLADPLRYTPRPGAVVWVTLPEIDVEELPTRGAWDEDILF